MLRETVWTLELLPYLEPLLARPQQPDNLCAPYWIALLLQAFGGQSVSAVEVAIAASTLLPDQDGTWTPPGAESLRGNGYSTIRTISSIDRCGTSLIGLMQATERVSQRQFCLLPLQIECWEDGLSELWQLCQAQPNWQIVPLLNSHTSYFWGADLSFEDLFSYLQTGQISPPPADWSVGHFALLAGCMTGQAARLYAILDTYLQFGWDGLHLQPGSAIAQSLARPERETAGGLALFLSTAVCSQVKQAVTDMGFQVATWDNGTPVSSGVS